MRLSEISIERPVLASVISLVILLFGVLALARLPDRELPNIDPPVVSVTTVFPGAAPEVVETSVTEPLEDELIGIEGVRHVTSVSREQVSSISVEFELSRDVDLAANDVRDRVARVRRRLPEEVEEPVVAKSDADARPVIWLALYGRGHDPIELSELAANRVRDRLAKLPGVSNVILGGERRLAMRVWIDRSRLTAQGLTVADVEAALRRENVDIPSGRLEGPEQEFTVRTLGELRTPAGYGALIVANRAGRPVRLRDVARVEVGAESERKRVRFNGTPAVAIGVVKRSRANTLDVARGVRAEVDRLRQELPRGVELAIGYDSAVFIERAIADVWKTLAGAGLLVVAVIYGFLRTFRATLVPAAAIPVSIFGSFAVLELLGFSVNTLTLMGLALAIGLVVDDAIVVLENVTRWIEAGEPPLAAARQGMREISFAVVAATVAVVAVFVPLALLQDKTGRLFREFGVTVAAAVAISGLVALTLSPALCARILRPRRGEGGLRARLARGFDRLSDLYQRGLEVSLSRRGVVALAALLWFAAGLVLLAYVPRELVPLEDRGTLLVFTRAPEGSTLDYTDRYQRQAEAILSGTPEVQRVLSVVALGIGTPGLVNEGVLFASLEPPGKRKRTTQEVAASLFAPLQGIAGIQAFPIVPSPLRQSFGTAPVSLVIEGTEIAQLAEQAQRVMREARREIPGLRNLRTDLLLNKPELVVAVDRERASDLGVSVREIAGTLQTLLGGRDLSTFKREGETHKVIVQLEADQRATLSDLMGLHVRGRDGALVPLDALVEVRETTSARGIPHFDRMRAARVTANLAPGQPLGAALERIGALARRVVAQTPGGRIGFSGESEDFFESGHALAFAYWLAVVVIYLVLAAQFESFVHPLTILVAVGLSFTGALVALLACRQSLNLFSEIGLVMLVGLVTKNSILIVEFANQLRSRGHGLLEATREAARLRLRPILMTAVSTVAGLLPIALGLGAGGEARASLGIAVAGGMVFSTALTVFVVPAVYLLIESVRARIARAERNPSTLSAAGATGAGAGR